MPTNNNRQELRLMALLTRRGSDSSFSMRQAMEELNDHKGFTATYGSSSGTSVDNQMVVAKKWRHSWC